MKINPVANPNILRSYQASRMDKNQTRITPGRDEVTFSDEALSFSKAMAEAKDAVEFRTPEEKEHIAAITNAIHQGTYKIGSEDVAEKILESALNR